MSNQSWASLRDFLLARIAEDEEVARAATPSAWVVGRASLTGIAPTPTSRMCLARATKPEDAAHIVTHGPARILAECEAKRRIVTDLAQIPVEDFTDGVHVQAQWAAARTLWNLAAAYANHPDYQQEWRL